MKLSASTQHIINREIARTFPKKAMFFIQLKRNGLSFRGQAVFILGYDPDGGIFFQPAHHQYTSGCCPEVDGAKSTIAGF